MKTHEVRYFSEMINSMALYGEYNSEERANEAARNFRLNVNDSGLSPQDKDKLWKSIKVW